ncbi:MAG: cofactor-independent phosphoglycerate mutase [Phycisphaerae bacterium]|nr:cofactor-independent phosphoglycerate mutase [Phycisphaerae bacterium]
MKYAIIIPDGAADLPQETLGGKTPLQVAQTPNMDAIAAAGRIGTVCNIPDDKPAGSDVAILSVLGYDPCEFYTGRAPLEAAAMNLPVTDNDWIFRCNLVTVIEGIMEDNSAGHISNKEGAAVIEALKKGLDPTGVGLYPGVGYRHIMTVAGDMNVTTIPPHDILGQPIAKNLPTGTGSEKLREIMQLANIVLKDCEINAVRRDLGENEATDIWLWGEGKMPTLPSFKDRFGLRGAAITAVDLVRGISMLIGWDVLEVEGATGYVETNYAGKGQRAVKAIDDYDLVFVHIEAPDEAGHNADIKGKVHAIEQIDQHIVAPVIERLKQEGDDWRVMVLPDHPTPLDVRTHTRTAVPFAIAGKRMEQVVPGQFDEITAEESDLHIPKGSGLMEFFLTVR